MVSLQEFLEKSGCEKNLAQLLGEVIPEAVRRIRIAISKQGGELAGSENVYGEKQLALDVQANQIVLDVLKASGLVSSAASEELEAVENFGEGKPFSVVSDPLDGSSLVDVNFAVGSIFGIYPSGDLLGRTGDEQLAACYAVYGPHTTFVLTFRPSPAKRDEAKQLMSRPSKASVGTTFKKGVHEFRLAADGNFYLTKENLKIAEDSKYFAPGNLRAAAEREDYLKLTNQWIKKGLTLRYSGGMVPDINHILLKGSGVFTYPGYSKAPQGKLRLLFECNPFALLVEQAGGEATDGKERILSKRITELHQRTPIFIGSVQEVKKITAF